MRTTRFAHRRNLPLNPEFPPLAHARRAHNARSRRVDQEHLHPASTHPPAEPSRLHHPTLGRAAPHASAPANVHPYLAPHLHRVSIPSFPPNLWHPTQLLFPSPSISTLGPGIPSFPPLPPSPTPILLTHTPAAESIPLRKGPRSQVSHPSNANVDLLLPTDHSTAPVLISTLVYHLLLLLFVLTTPAFVIHKISLLEQAKLSDGPLPGPSTESARRLASLSEDHHCSPSRLRILLKTSNPTRYRFRPITDTTNASLRCLDRHLASAYQQLLSWLNPSWILKNADDVPNLLNSHPLTHAPHSLLQTDIRDMYTNLPHQKILQAVDFAYIRATHLGQRTLTVNGITVCREELLYLTRNLLTRHRVTVPISTGSLLLEMKDGIPMGAISSPTLALLCFLPFEFPLAMEFPNILFVRYVDNIMILAPTISHPFVRRYLQALRSFDLGYDPLDILTPSHPFTFLDLTISYSTPSNPPLPTFTCLLKPPQPSKPIMYNADYASSISRGEGFRVQRRSPTPLDAAAAASHLAPLFPEPEPAFNRMLEAIVHPRATMRLDGLFYHYCPQPVKQTPLEVAPVHLNPSLGPLSLRRPPALYSFRKTILYSLSLPDQRLHNTLLYHLSSLVPTLKILRPDRATALIAHLPDHPDFPDFQEIDELLTRHLNTYARPSDSEYYLSPTLSTQLASRYHLNTSLFNHLFNFDPTYPNIYLAPTPSPLPLRDFFCNGLCPSPPHLLGFYANPPFYLIPQFAKVLLFTPHPFYGVVVVPQHRTHSFSRIAHYSLHHGLLPFHPNLSFKSDVNARLLRPGIPCDILLITSTPPPSSLPIQLPPPPLPDCFLSSLPTTPLLTPPHTWPQASS